MLTDNFISFFTFGYEKAIGYGYKFSEKTSLRFLNGSDIHWTWFNVSNDAPSGLDAPDMPLLHPDLTYLSDGVRFGQKYSSEIDFEIYNGFCLVASADRNIIFPRFVFLEYLGSEIIFLVGSGLLSTFTNAIKKSSPRIYPVMNFVLNSALSYGITELQKKKMN